MPGIFRADQKYENIFVAIGVHPHSAAQISEEDFQRIPGFLKNKKVVAVGEVGLDYYRNLSPQDKQRELFSRFIGLSLDSQLPLIIHSREAEADTIALLKTAAGANIKGSSALFFREPGFLPAVLRFRPTYFFYLQCNL